MSIPRTLILEHSSQTGEGAAGRIRPGPREQHMTGAKGNHRLNHIFRDNGRTLIVAMDHPALFGVMGGLERPGEVIQKVRRGGADALLTTFGAGKRFVREIGNMGLILRVDGGASALAQERGPLHLIHPIEDALRLGLEGAQRVVVITEAGSVETGLEVSDEVAEGVVSLPHGWGHDRKGTRLAVAESFPGVSANDLTDENVVDVLTGNAVLNGILVRVERAGRDARGGG